MIADQQLVRVSVVCSHTVPKSVSARRIPIVLSGRYVLVGSSFEVGLVSSLVVNENYFSELEEEKQRV